MARFRFIIPGVDQTLLVKDAAKLLPDPSRRRFLAGGASLGALTMLTGCDVSDSFSAEKMLAQISKFNDAVQAKIFNPNTLAPEYNAKDVKRPFPFNAFYTLDEAPQIDGEDWKLDITGMAANKKPWTLKELNALPQVTQITRHICVEGWSAIGSWSGVPLRDFLQRIGADTSAKFITFRCAEDYWTTLDMPTCLHPQTQMTLKFDGETLPRAYGFPMKVRVPTRLGFKNPKYVVAMDIGNDHQGGYWEDQGYNDYSGI